MKELLEATYFGIFGQRMSKKENKYKILHQIIDATTKTFVFEWNDAFSSLENSKVEYQRNAIIYFLQNELGIEEEICRLDSGAPFFKSNSRHISISHSDQLFAVQLSTIDSVGVDVQIVKKNIHRGRAYFINDFEEKSYEMTNRELHLIWSAKECVYKLKKGDVEHYREDISVTELSNDMISVEINQKERISCQFVFEEKYVLVFI